MKRFLFLLLFVAPLFSFSQSNYIKGYVITESGDTLKGYINYREHLSNPTSFAFKSATDSKPQVFTLKNCSGFVIADIDAYQRDVVRISMGSVATSSLSTGLDSASRQDTVFLRVLQTGKNVTLFSYTDDLKKRFYLKDKNDAVPYELLKQVFFDREQTSTVITNDKYRRQLLVVMRKFNVSSSAVEQRLTSLSYDETDILRIVNEINGQEYIKTQYPKTRFFAGLGFMHNQTRYAGISDFANSNVTSKDSYSPVLTAGLDLFANPAIGKLIYRLELSLMMSKTDVSAPRPNDNGNSKNVSFTQYSAIVAPQLIYNIYNTERFKFFIGGGVGFNISGYSKNKYYFTNFYGQVTPVEPEDLQPISFLVPFSAGVVIHKRIELSAGYTVPFNIISGGVYSIRMERYKAGISYLFGK